MFWTPSILNNIYRPFMSNRNMIGIFAIFAIFRFAPSHFFRYTKSRFWVNWYETWYWSKQKVQMAWSSKCKQLANGVSNCLEPLLIFPWVMNIHTHIAHCVYTILHARVQNMKNCEESVFVWVWQTSKVLQNWLTWNTNNPNKQEGECRMMIYDFY